jgi:hypothetical protein
MAGASRVLHAQQLGADIFSLSPIEKASIIYWKNNLRIDYKKTFDMFLRNFTDTIWNFCLSRRDRSSLWISEQNSPTKWRYFGYKNNLYGTKGTFIV